MSVRKKVKQENFQSEVSVVSSHHGSHLRKARQTRLRLPQLALPLEKIDLVDETCNALA